MRNRMVVAVSLVTLLATPTAFDVSEVTAQQPRVDCVWTAPSAAGQVPQSRCGDDAAVFALREAWLAEC